MNKIFPGRLYSLEGFIVTVPISSFIQMVLWMISPDDYPCSRYRRTIISDQIISDHIVSNQK